MKVISVLLVISFFMAVLTPSLTISAHPLPPTPSSRPPVRPDATEIRRASELYMLAKRENRRLSWDQCLARKAFIRAKQLVTEGYFEHHDPATGKNPAWELVRRCFPCRSAGENLVKGMDRPEKVHQALMNSPTHRRNILNPRFQRLGVACYDYVCVELFAGF